MSAGRHARLLPEFGRRVNFTRVKPIQGVGGKVEKSAQSPDAIGIGRFPRDGKI
jgi:hypothetical protein